MQEEFHGVWNGTATTAWKQKYGWNTLNANIWLPSLSELVGYSGEVNATAGTYYSAMQGLNMSGKWYWVDPNGGTQFAYLSRYNTSGGLNQLWTLCGKEPAWLRTTVQANGFAARAVVETGIIGDSTGTVTASRAVHPAG